MRHGLPENKPWKGGKSQTAQGERSVTLGIRHQNYIAQDRGIGGYGVPVRNDIFANAMIFRKSLPPR